MAAPRAGAKLYTNSAVSEITRVPDGWRLATRNGTLTAHHVALCTNAYQGQFVPGLAQSQVPVYSMITATATLPDEIRRQIMPSGAVLYEQADITVYYHLDAHGRLLIGGRSPSRDISAADTSFLRRYALGLWPVLQGAEWTHLWNGQLAVTTDHLPHFHEPAPGLTAILGCNGRGVALMTALGRDLGLRIGSGNTRDMIPVPTAISRIPFHRFWKLGVALRLAHGRIMDRVRP